MAENPATTILFVDDDVSNRQAMSWLFREAGYHVLEASTGEEALLLAEKGADLVVLDVNLPDITGYEVCRRLRAQPRARPVSVLQMSAVYVGSGDRSLGLEEGADAYLIKPVEPRELLATAKALLRAHTAEEAALRASQEWRTTFDAISDAVSLVDHQGSICRCNRAMSELVGQPFDQILGKPLADVLRRGLVLDAVPLLMQPAEHCEREVQEIRLGQRWFRLTFDPIRAADGKVQGGVYILRDVTRRKELEEQLRQSQKLEAVGRLAGGVAHDFNNLLTAILGNASLLLRTLPEGEPEHELVATIERAASRAADLTRQLLGFSRQALLWLETVEPAKLLATVMADLQRSMPASIDLVGDWPDDLWPIQADPRQLSQVLRHLCLNALDAMPQGGRLVVTAANEQVDEEEASRHADARPGTFVRVRIQDTGEGIPAELLDKIFDPFFTTKPVGRGSGLGLAMAHGIIKQHLGWVQCHSDRGSGTRFDLYFPRYQPVSAMTGPTPALVAAPAGVRRLLLADDNETLRSLAATYLRQGGFEVVVAGDGKEAVDLFGRDHAQFDLVILDEMMPGLTGQEALAQMRQIHPGVRVLLASSDWASPSAGEVLPRVAKPYRERDLLQAVENVLAPTEGETVPGQSGMGPDLQ